MYHKRIEEREDGGTPAIVQKIRCALALWVKEFMGNALIEQRESFFISKAMKRLSQNPNVEVLGNTRAKRAPILSFVVYTRERRYRSSWPTCNNKNDYYYNGNDDIGVKARIVRGKPLHGRFVAKLLNDLFGIQARGGCACAGPYGHTLLGVSQEQSLALRTVIEKVTISPPLLIMTT